LKRHLAPFGLPADIVEWKYFSAAVRHEGENGFVWLREGEVRGCIGLIAFEVHQPAGNIPAAWTCDWLVDSPQSNAGIGVMLMRHAQKAVPLLFSIGGNELNLQLMPRLAAFSFPESSVEVHVPLRAGGSAWFRGLDRRLGGILRPLQHAPLRTGRVRQLQIEQGVSPLLEDIIAECGSETSPLYTLAYLRWQIQDCPTLQSATCYASPRDMKAASLCWSSKSAGTDWRLALWSRDDASRQTKDVLDATLRYVFERGGQRVSAIHSRADHVRASLLASRGFVSSGRPRPLFLAAPGSWNGGELTGLSFVDSDLAYRF
jgi:hypothetical protein